jgi:DNA-binding transcriptional regulator YiaG
MRTPPLSRDLTALMEVRQWAASGHALRIREQSGTSQAEWATVVGTTVPTISRWERGLRVPRGEAALRYHALLKSLKKQLKESAA